MGEDEAPDHVPAGLQRSPGLRSRLAWRGSHVTYFYAASYEDADWDRLMARELIESVLNTVARSA